MGPAGDPVEVEAFAKPPRGGMATPLKWPNCQVNTVSVHIA